jgi:trk system potassium uptake protein
MKIIILGGNQVGGALAENLVYEQHDVTVVDTDIEKLKALEARLDLNTVCGHAPYPTVLKKAGVDDADLLIAVTSNDEANLVACQVAHTLFHLPTKIARLRSPEYFRFPRLFGKDQLPVDVFISPEKLVTNYIRRLVEHPGALQVLDFADGKVKLVAIKPFFGGPLVGRDVASLKKDLKLDARIVAVFRQNKSITPEADTVFEVGDEVFFIAATEDIRKVMSALRRLDNPYKRILIAGGGNMGLSVARALEHKYKVKILEQDALRAEYIATELESAMVLQGHASDKELLHNENIDSVDVFCALMPNDEDNIMSCMLAKKMGVRTVMALIQRTVYVDLIESSTVDVAISPQQATIGHILRYIRRGDVENVYSLRRGVAEAIELVAHGDEGSSKVIGRTIGDLRLPQGVMVGAIVRGEQVLMGHKKEVVQSKDHVILFLADKKKIRDIEKLFQVSLGFFG